MKSGNESGTLWLPFGEQKGQDVKADWPFNSMLQILHILSHSASRGRQAAEGDESSSGWDRWEG